MFYAVCPKVPFGKNFKFEVGPGFQLTVTGHSYAAYHTALEVPTIKGFQINLTGENSVDGSRALHFNPRFDNSHVVLNTRHEGAWGSEEIHASHHFHGGQDFTVVIQAHEDEFKIYVNGHHFADYKYRVPINSVTGVFIKGLVTLHQVIAKNYESNSFPSLVEHVPSDVQAQSDFPIVLEKPSLPVNIDLPDGAKPGLIVAIVGKPVENTNRFHINFKSGEDYALHFNPRFDGNDVVVRNTKHDGSWGQEERDHESPFKPDSKFRIFMKSHPTHYEVWVNGAHFCDYQHRQIPLHAVTKINIDGDVKIKNVVVTY